MKLIICFQIYEILFSKFEDTKGVIRIQIYRRRADSTMAKRKSTKGQTTIYKTYT